MERFSKISKALKKKAQCAENKQNIPDDCDAIFKTGNNENNQMNIQALTTVISKDGLTNVFRFPF